MKLCVPALLPFLCLWLCRNMLILLVVSIVSYNILADSYADPKFFPKSNEKVLAWPRRREKILELLQELDPDIICLQELEKDHYEDFFTKVLVDFSSIFKKRTFIKPDGCGIFFRSSRWRLLHHLDVELNELAEYKEIQTQKRKISDYSTNNIGQIALLERISDASKPDKAPSRHIWIANVHLYWNPDYPDVKLLQAWKMVQEIEVARTTFLRGQFGSAPVVFVGDYNSLPNSAVYRFLTNGNIPGKEQGKLGLDLFGPLKHDLQLASANSEIGEPLSNITAKFSGCLDYIWYDRAQLQLRTVLGKLDSSLYDEAMLPNESQPSDHIPLFAKFSFL